MTVEVKIGVRNVAREITLESVQTAEAVACWLIEAVSACGCEVGLNPTFSPAAEAVTRTAVPVTATAPAARPATRR